MGEITPATKPTSNYINTINSKAMYQIRIKALPTDSYLISEDGPTFRNKPNWAIQYPTKEEAETVATKIGCGAYAEEVPTDPYTLCLPQENNSRWQIDICDSRGRTEATINADTKEGAEKRGEWLCKCLNDHAQIFH